jgi:hypothetical protein
MANLDTVVSLAILLTFACGPQLVLGSNAFLKNKPKSLMPNKVFRAEVMNAVGSMLGCGGEHDKEQVAEITKSLTPMWRTLPKTNGRIDRRSLRYLVHRHFMQTSSLMVRGFEPTRLTNDSHWGAADILSQMVPAYVESVLESQHNTMYGFNLKDAVDMVVMLDQLIFDSESALLEGVYKDQKKSTKQSLSHDEVAQIFESYVVGWMIEASPEDHALLNNNKSLAAELLPHYHDLMKFTEGRIKTFEYERSKGKDALNLKYSFGDVHKIAGGITRSFQSYWQSECESMKSALVSMDSHNTGRVPLAKFYNTALDSDWRFGESEAYLRELGALDESSSWRGAQVLIPNYLQATSNCIVSTPHYLVCCVNECESLMGEFETAIDAPTALPETILGVVGNMTSHTTLDADEPAHLNKELRQQLEQIAKNTDGRVPLHGRLFAQWLHYVFPRECPFPHKAGVTTATTPSEYGMEHIASKADMKKHAESATDIPVSVSQEELQWMSQWSEDEELMVDYSSEFRGSSWARTFLLIFGLLVVLVGLAVGAVTIHTAPRKVGAGMARSAPMHNSHWV